MQKMAKKDWTKLSILIVLIVSFEIAHASSGQFFAGRITQAPDQEVQSLADSDYTCEPENTTIDIQSFKGPTAYYIPQGTESKTKNQQKDGQLVIGRYSGTTTITCTEDTEPYDVQTFQFNTIDMWANSKQ
ncbi:MAG: hypothetical protein NTW62_02180 [Candidatus Nomurabacteria bacterium]|nr:hypothetical protein [Candidatus Nomurabacteria bacterium]